MDRRLSSPPIMLVLIGRPMTGSVVYAARTPPRCAALPAAAMMTPKPRSAADFAKASAAAGVRCAEMTCASNGTPNFLSCEMAPCTTGRSLSEPMMTATFFNKLILSAMAAKQKRQSRPCKGKDCPDGRHFTCFLLPCGLPTAPSVTKSVDSDTLILAWTARCVNVKPA